MKIWKYNIIIICICALILSTFTVSAESLTDSTGDVYYWAGTEGAWSWKQNIHRDNIDITEVSSVINGDNITITFKVVGTIQTTEKFGYYYYYNTSDTTYWVVVSGGSPIAMAIMQAGGEGSYAQGETVINGNTISSEFKILGDTTPQEIWGWAAEWTNVSGDVTNHEWWGDWVPNSKFTGTISGNETGGNDTGGSNDKNNSGSKEKSPGFEAIAVIAAIGLALILFKRRK